MKFKTLTVKNFKNIAEKEFELSKFNLLYGKNGSGKSGILAAFRFLLNGDLSKDAIKDGENELYVCASIDDGNNTTIARYSYLPEERQINGKSVKDSVFFARVQEAKAEFQAAPYEPKLLSHTHRYFLDKGPEILFSFLETGTVDGTRLHGVKEIELELADGTVLYRRASKQNRVEINGRKCTITAFNQMLEQYGIHDPRAMDIVTSSDMMGKLGMADFGRYLLQNLPVKIDFDKLAELAELDPEEKETLRPLFPPVPGIITVDHVEKVYAQVFDVRTMVNNNAKAELQKSVFDGEPPKETMEEVTAAIADANQEVGSYKALEKAHRDYEISVMNRKKMLDQVAELKKKLEDPKFSGLTQPDHNTLNTLRDTEKNAYQSRQIAYNNFYSLKETVRLHKEAVAALDSSQCPVYKGLVCKMDRSSYREELVRLVNEASQGVLNAQKAYKDASRILEETTKQKEALEAKIRLWNEKCSIETQVNTLSASIPAEPEKPQPLPDISKVNEKLVRLNALIPLINAYNAAGKAKEQYKKIMEQHALYDRLVKKTNPKNGLLVSVIMQQVLAPFTSHCNSVAQAIYPDCEIKFAMNEKGLEAYFRPHGKECALPPEALSTGEKMQLTFVLMDLVSTVSGSRMLVFDNMEALDGNSIGHLLRLVEKKELKDRYDHILFAVVEHESIMKEISAISSIQKIAMA